MWDICGWPQASLLKFEYLWKIFSIASDIKMKKETKSWWPKKAPKINIYYGLSEVGFRYTTAKQDNSHHMLLENTFNLMS